MISVKQTFLDNTLEEDIIFKCKLYDLISYKYSNDHYSYTITDLKSGTTLCSAQTRDGDIAENCITDEQLQCLESYGVTFFNGFTKQKDISNNFLYVVFILSPILL